MPNWCSNNLTLEHKDTAKISQVLEAFRAGDLLNYFVPLPDGNWNYDFCIHNWGTKWEVEGDVDANEEHLVTFSFDSAWSPPTGAYLAMAEQGFKVTAFYWEPGMAFVGKWTGQGNEYHDDYFEYGDMSLSEIRDYIGEELDDMFGISDAINETEEDLRRELDEIVMNFDSVDEVPDHEDLDLPPHTD